MRIKKYIKGNKLINDYLKSDVESDQLALNSLTGLLDVQSHQLTNEECGEIDMFDFLKYNLKYEKNYLDLYQRLLDTERDYIIVLLDWKNLDSVKIARMLEGLDYKEKLVLIDILRELDLQCEDVFFKTKDADLVRMLCMLGTRELCFIRMIFPSRTMCIVPGYDLCFEVFFKNEDLIEDMKLLVSTKELFIRSITD